MNKRIEKDESVKGMRTIFNLKSEEEVKSAIKKHNDKVREGDWIIAWK
jgi:hypothetical protein